MLVLQRAMRPTDADVLHDNLGRVVPPNGHLLILLQIYDIPVKLFPTILNLIVLKLCIRRLKCSKVEERVGFALVLKLVGKGMLAQLA
jgi:hypothetical protein